jgi:hypothetical protein
MALTIFDMKWFYNLFSICSIFFIFSIFCILYILLIIGDYCKDKQNKFF